MNNRKLLTYGRLLLSVILLTVLVFGIDRQAFVQILSQIQLDYYLLGVVLFFLSIVVSAYRWQLILVTSGHSYGLWQLTAINLSGNFFSNFLPTAIGGDVVRIVELTQQGDADRHDAVSTVMLDRLIGLISVALMAALALVAGFSTVESPAVRAVVLGALGALPIGWAIFFYKPVVRKFRWLLGLPLLCRVEETLVRLYQTLYALQGQKSLLVSSLAISLVLQVIEVIAVILLARSLSIQLPAHYFFLFLPLIWLVTMLPLSLNGLGLREGAFTFFFGLVGVAAPQAIALALLVYACRLLSGIAGGALYARATLGRQRLPVAQTE
jgi:uncharacterized protein (TIRG00374 family)